MSDGSWIEPLETLYADNRFRSRLEARWALFFDVLAIAWEYEPEGYSLNGSGYRPDFWLPNWKCFVEIKRQGAPAAECEKSLELSRRLSCVVLVIRGKPQIPEYSIDLMDGGEVVDERLRIYPCPGCDGFMLARYYHMGQHYEPSGPGFMRLMAAQERACSERFEGRRRREPPYAP